MVSRKNVLVAAALFLALAGPLNWWTAHRVASAPSDVAPSQDASTGTLRAILDGSGPPLPRPADLVEVQDGLAALYGHEPVPLWTRERRLRPRAGIAVEMLRQADLDGLIAAAMAGTRTMSVAVDPPIPVFVFYTTAIVRADEAVEFFDDVYGLGARLESDLALPRRR